MIHIIKTILRPTDDLVQGLSRHGSATVHEAMGRFGAMNHAIKPLARGMKVCGPAFTVKTPPGDNVMLLRATSSCSTPAASWKAARSAS